MNISKTILLIKKANTFFFFEYCAFENLLINIKSKEKTNNPILVGCIITAAKVENTNNLIKLINPILAKYSTKNEISIILQKKDLIIGKTELDITDEIIKIINVEIKEFKIK